MADPHFFKNVSNFLGLVVQGGELVEDGDIGSKPIEAEDVLGAAKSGATSSAKAGAAAAGA